MDLPHPFIVTLKMDAELQNQLDTLRQAHFPAERNFLRAHITLFHALPADQSDPIHATLSQIAAAHSPFELQLNTLRFLGRGVAISVTSPPLLALRNQLAKGWWDLLNNQDRQRFSPHVTIQNKVDPAIARKTFQYLNEQWPSTAGQALGLDLWRYQGGPWAAVRSFEFENPAA